MREADFQKQIVDAATLLGWRCWHVPTPMKPVGGNRFVPDSRGRGLPDLLLVHENPPRLVFAELKNETGKLSDEQTEMLRMLRQVGDRTVDEYGERIVGAYMWSPAVADLAQTILRGKAAL